jgi:DNA-binding GntR family transcriptional regulator
MRTVQEIIAEDLRKSIIGGEFHPGDRLVQDEIATRYGVSRIPVREAFRTLSAEGLVTFHRRRGAIVTMLTREDIQEILSIRSVLEGMGTRLAAERITPKQLERVCEIFKKMEASRDNPERFFKLNFEFHAAILDGAQSPRLKEIIVNLRNTVETVARQYLARAERVETAHGDHAAILEALENHDVEAAEQLASRHTQHVLAGILDDYDHTRFRDGKK